MKPIQLREGTYEHQTIKEIVPTYGWMDPKDKICLDIGGCFGATTRLLCEKGAKHVVIVEPEPTNFEQIKINTEGLPVTPIHAAVVPASFEHPFVTLWKTNGYNTGANSLHVKGSKRTPIEVPVVHFETLLDLYEPEVLKIDCEGAEYDFLTFELPDFVRQITIEIHLGKKAWREQAAPALAALFNDWEVVKQPVLDKGYWHTIGAWKR